MTRGGYRSEGEDASKPEGEEDDMEKLTKMSVCVLKLFAVLTTCALFLQVLIEAC